LAAHRCQNKMCRNLIMIYQFLISLTEFCISLLGLLGETEYKLNRMRDLKRMVPSGMRQ